MVERLRKAYTRYIEAYRDYLRVRQELAIRERIQVLKMKKENLERKIKEINESLNKKDYNL